MGAQVVRGVFRTLELTPSRKRAERSNTLSDRLASPPGGVRRSAPRGQFFSARDDVGWTSSSLRRVLGLQEQQPVGCAWKGLDVAPRRSCKGAGARKCPVSRPRQGWSSQTTSTSRRLPWTPPGLGFRPRRPLPLRLEGLLSCAASPVTKRVQSVTAWEAKGSPRWGGFVMLQCISRFPRAACACYT